MSDEKYCTNVINAPLGYLKVITLGVFGIEYIDRSNNLENYRD
jgi:hypothetical protein